MSSGTGILHLDIGEAILKVNRDAVTFESINALSSIKHFRVIVHFAVVITKLDLGMDSLSIQ